jgi:hypothetical protein
MTKRTAKELQNMAQMYRGMCDDGGDPQLIDALAVLAFEFELEAGALEDPGDGD